jgi:hypothetical protein
MSSISTPLAVPPPLSGAFTRRAFWFAALLTVLIFLARLYAPCFIVDSWSYLELSNTVFKDFYHFNTLRHFENPSPYSQAFPPLWPVLLAVARKVADVGIYTGYILNCALCVVLLAVLIRLFRAINLPGWVGIACYMSILGFPPFLGGALGAKSLPLSLTLLTGTLLALVREPINARRVSLAGLIMGMACLTRFDAISGACVIGLAFGARAYLLERRLRRCVAVVLIYYATFCIVLSPMVVYGITHFGKPFPSDNTRMLMQARGGTVLDYYETPPSADLLQNPGKWLAGLVSYKAPRIVFGFYEAASESVLFPFLAVVLVVWGAARSPSLPSRATQFVLIALVLVPVMLLPSMLVGFMDFRFYAGPALLLFAVLFGLLVSLTAGVWNPRRATLLLLAVALLLCETAAQPLVSNRSLKFSLAEALAPLSPTDQMRELTDAVHRDSGGQPHRLLLTSGYVGAVKYGALTGEPTSVMPVLVNGSFAAFARDWHITHIYEGSIKHVPWQPETTDRAEITRIIRVAGIELVPLDLPGLYRIRLTSTLPRPPISHADPSGRE